ncbi:hypothetical protein PsorP6_007449 [Peronosclerospora sorghi]|uniref:Uncharacterized protein n=1 Tax=Peronosclerospora sorghi TaxID=230839 RepID=A0ACC0WAU3_9STRA|nr:hypothetical protein PsorP6_007449 [Peronosclerospora sorghi]
MRTCVFCLSVPSGSSAKVYQLCNKMFCAPMNFWLRLVLLVRLQLAHWRTFPLSVLLNSLHGDEKATVLLGARKTSVKTIKNDFHSSSYCFRLYFAHLVHSKLTSIGQRHGVFYRRTFSLVPLPEMDLKTILRVKCMCLICFNRSLPSVKQFKLLKDNLIRKLEPQMRTLPRLCAFAERLEAAASLVNDQPSVIKFSLNSTSSSPSGWIDRLLPPLELMEKEERRFHSSTNELFLFQFLSLPFSTVRGPCGHREIFLDSPLVLLRFKLLNHVLLGFTNTLGATSRSTKFCLYFNELWVGFHHIFQLLSRFPKEPVQILNA